MTALRLLTLLLLTGAALAAPLGARAQDADRPSPIAVSVDWAKTTGKVSPAAYGLNLYAAASPKNFDSAAYKANIEYMGAGLVRFHNAGKLNDSVRSWEGLIDETARTWDRPKIRRMLAAARYAQKPLLLVNVPGWPSWMDADKDGFLDRDQFDAYAALLADLVRIVNVENKAGAVYWEITNEWDGRYFTDFYEKGGWGPLKDPKRPDRWDEVAEVYNRCAVAMKKADPSIKTGGPAAARPDLSKMHERFAKATLPNLDFFSLHAYASGSKDTPDAEVYDKAESTARYAKSAIEMLRRLSPAREIPVMVGEYNISWTWETRDPRMSDNKGAVYDSLVMAACAEAGVYSVQSWNEKDGIYGKTDGEDRRRPGAEVLHLFNAYLCGRRVAATSADAKRVVVYATVDADGRRSLLLINRTGEAQVAQARLSGAPRGTWERHEIGPKGSSDTTEALTTDGATWTLPPHSVTVLTTGTAAAKPVAGR